MESDWITCQKPWRTYDGTPCFTDEVQRKRESLAGLLIEVEGDEEPYELLIGNINEMRGVCDDCTEFEPARVVLRYRRVYVNKAQ